MRVLFALGLPILLVMGCGSGKFAPVSGKVTLNDKPLANATVSFQPVAEAGSANAGPGSSGKTNEKGEYTLTASTGENGAWVGKHQVRISRHKIVQNPDEDTGDRRGGPPQTDEVPERYNAQTTLTFQVPPGGTDKADFSLKAP